MTIYSSTFIQKKKLKRKKYTNWRIFTISAEFIVYSKSEGIPMVKNTFEMHSHSQYFNMN